jgi:hypothetical protein
VLLLGRLSEPVQAERLRRLCQFVQVRVQLLDEAGKLGAGALGFPTQVLQDARLVGRR